MFNDRSIDNGAGETVSSPTELSVMHWPHRRTQGFQLRA